MEKKKTNVINECNPITPVEVVFSHAAIKHKLPPNKRWDFIPKQMIQVDVGEGESKPKFFTAHFK